MKLKRDPFAVIVEAAKYGRGAMLSAAECEFMASQPCIPGNVGQSGVEWRTIDGFSRYEISERGQVRRGYRILKQTEHRSRHLSVTIYGDYGKQWRAGVHHLVARAFLGDPPDGKPYACHENGRAWENHKDNIYWGSHADNVADMVRHASLDGRGKSVGSERPTIENPDGTGIS